MVSGQSQVEVTVAASVGLDGDGGWGPPWRRSRWVFYFSLARNAEAGLVVGTQARLNPS